MEPKTGTKFFFGFRFYGTTETLVYSENFVVTFCYFSLLSVMFCYFLMRNVTFDVTFCYFSLLRVLYFVTLRYFRGD